MTEENDIFSFLDHVCSKSLELARSFDFDKNHQLHFHSITLYGTIIELTFSIIHISKCDTKVGLLIVLRSQLEAAIDLLNLCENPRYGYRLEVDFLRYWLDYLGEARRGENPYLKNLGEQSLVSDTINEYKTRRTQLAAQGHKRIDIKEKFNIAGMEHEYSSVYSRLCAHTHNSLQALRERHAEIADNDFKIVYFRETSLENLALYAGMACEMLMRSTEAVHKLLDSSVISEVESLRNEVEEFRQTRGDA